jgi:hypothetical protein
MAGMWNMPRDWRSRSRENFPDPTRWPAISKGVSRKIHSSKFTYVPVLRAISALQRGRPAASIEQLQITLPYELAANGLSFQHYHSAYVRGEAFAAAQQYAEAIAEFQKILDHRGVVGPDPIGALVYLPLGRTFAQSGDKAKANTVVPLQLAGNRCLGR